MTRRSNFTESPLSYVEIGASEAEDLLQFPPRGATPFEIDAWLGSGEDRFQQSATALMTLRHVARADGEVADLTPGTAPSYRGENEGVYGPDGSAYVTDNTRFSVRHGGVARGFLVIRTIVTDDVVGLILGTTDRDGVTGEMVMTVQRREDGKVWGVARGFIHPGPGRFSNRGVKKAQHAIRRALEALKPGTSER